MMRSKWGLSFVAATLLTVLSASAGLAGDWAGTYLTEDTKGHAFAITLSEDAVARGEKDGHVLNGSWSVEGASVLIKWTTGWTTKLSTDENGYSKTAFRPGAPLTDEGAKAIAAKKVD